MPFKPFPGQLNKDGVIIIPKGYVKLPEPAVSDYIIPTGASASSFDTTPDTSKTVVDDSFENSTSWTPFNNNSDFSLSYDYDSSTYVDGAYSLHISISSSSNSAYPLNFGIKKTLDLSKISIISAYVKVSSSNSSVTPTVYLKVVDASGNTIASTSVSNPGSFTQLTLDVSNIIGTYTVLIQFYYSTGYYGTHELWVDYVTTNPYLHRYENTIDNDTSTTWKPSSANAGEWIQIDAGSNSIIGGARIYWGSNVPNKYRIQASTDGSTWVDVYTATSSPTANDWTEYSWPAVYARYLRLYLDDQGSNPVEVAEFQYYSRITDRVAAEHGHGSGPEPWREGAFFSSFMRAMSKGTGITPRIAAVRGSHRKKRLNQKINDKKKKSRLTKKDILELIEELREYIDFKVPD